jgi:hypothetical protein
MSIASRMISKEELADLGVERLAYVKCVAFADREVYAVHGAPVARIFASSRIGTRPSRPSVHHAFEPVCIH